MCICLSFAILNSVVYRSEIDLIVNKFNSRNEGSQVAVLKIVQRLLKKLTVAELQFIFPSVTAFITHPSILCRELMYDILIWIYDMLRLVFIFLFSFVLLVNSSNEEESGY